MTNLNTNGADAETVDKPTGAALVPVSKVSEVNEIDGTQLDSTKLN